MVALLAPRSGYVPTTAAQRLGSGTMALALLTALALALLLWRPVPAEPPLPEPPKVFRPLQAPPPPPRVTPPPPARAKQPVAPDAPRERRPAPAPQPQPAAAAPVSLAPLSPDPTTVDITPVAIAPPVALPNLASGTGRGEAGRVGEAPGQGGAGGSGGSGSGGGGSTLVRAQWAEELSWDDIRPYHPKAALAKGLSGRATLICRVRRTKRAEGCEVLSESPAGEGFGAAALAMERLYRIEPRRVNGKIVDNWRAFFTVNFYAKER